MTDWYKVEFAVARPGKGEIDFTRMEDAILAFAEALGEGDLFIDSVNFMAERIGG